MSEWKKYKLGEVIKLKRGFDLPNAKRRLGRYPIISSSGITGYHDEFRVDGPGVVTGRYGTIGEVFFERNNFWPLNTTLYVESFNGHDKKYIYYLLKTFDFNKFSDKSTVPGVNRNHLHEETISLPSLPTQRRIAAILSSLDDKIELNNAINKNLEELAQTLFKRWFVDFEFPMPEDYAASIGKPELAGQPYKSSGGEMVESEMGMIPKDFKVLSYLDFAKLHSGGTPKTTKPEYWDGDLYWISAKDVSPNNKRFILSTERRISELGVSNSSAKLLPKYSTIITARGTVGNYCIIPYPMAISQSNYAFSSSFPFYNFQVIGSLIESLKQRSYGTVFDTITTKTLQDSKIIVSDDTILDKYEQTIRNVYELILANSFESDKLVNLRDTILPRLISGRIGF